MITQRLKSILPSVVSVAALLALFAAGPAAAATPNQFVLQSHFGREVDKTTAANVCTIASMDECQPGKESGEAAGYLFPGSVAVNREGDVYVADGVNHRVQELSPQGVFITMFGWNVDKTKVALGNGASQQEKNVCTAMSSDVCGEGEEGTGLAEQIGGAQAIAVDTAVAGGGVYVLDLNNHRVDQYTAAGAFVLMIGGEVNETQDNTPGATEAQKNLCTAASICRTGVPSETGVHAHGAFNPEAAGDMLAIGGPEDLLYVGDEARVQEFKANGVWANEVSLAALSETGRATDIAVDPAGDLFVGDSEAAGVREFNAAKQLQPQVIAPAVGSGSAFLKGLAVNSNGQLALLVGEITTGAFSEFRTSGLLYSTAGAKLSEFGPPTENLPGFPDGLTFAPASAPAPNELYVIEPSTQEVEAYEPIVFAGMLTCPAEQVAATSAVLCGEVNPNGLSTNAFFDYGTSPALGSRTPLAFSGTGSTIEPVHATVAGLVPNQTYLYKLAAEDQVNGHPLVEHGAQQEFHTPAVPPQIVGTPSASFVTAQTAVLTASLNPEHLNTRYHFEYGACPSLTTCATTQSTSDLESSQYAITNTAQELQGLAPQTTYSYRLIASNEAEEEGKLIGGKATGVEGTFTTAGAPTVQAATGPASAVTATTAVISGTVNSDGQPATYALELGVYAGASTAYGVIASGAVPAENAVVGESQQLTGLQPGTAYAYRIVTHSGYGNAEGQPGTFTTAGLPSVLTSPPVEGLLAIPAITFPKESPATTTPKTLTSAQKLAGALKVCQKKPKKQRAGCEKQARKKYAPAARKKAKKK